MGFNGFFKSFRFRAVFLCLVWILLFVLSMSTLEMLLGAFTSKAHVQSLISLTWSGYVVSSDFSYPTPEVIGVSAHWVVPYVTLSVSNTYSSAWIGIGGQFDNSLIQIGTEHDSVNGKERILAWYELLPDYAVNIPMNISAGDYMSASINLIDNSTGLWLMRIANLSNGESFSKNVYYNSTLLSGEWIVERPTLNGKVSELANFGVVTFTEAYVNINNEVLPIGKTSFSQIHLTDHQNTQLTTISKISPEGTSFTVQYIANGF